MFTPCGGGGGAYTSTALTPFSVSIPAWARFVLVKAALMAFLALSKSLTLQTLESFVTRRAADAAPAVASEVGFIEVRRRESWSTDFLVTVKVEDSSSQRGRIVARCSGGMGVSVRFLDKSLEGRREFHIAGMV